MKENFTERETTDLGLATAVLAELAAHSRVADTDRDGTLQDVRGVHHNARTDIYHHSCSHGVKQRKRNRKSQANPDQNTQFFNAERRKKIRHHQQKKRVSKQFRKDPPSVCIAP